MLIIVFNELGLIMSFLPAMVASFLLVSLPASGEAWTLAGGWAAVVFLRDVIYRTLNPGEGEPWLGSQRGGHLFFIPVCLWGLLVFWWYAHHAWSAGYWLPHFAAQPGTSPAPP